MSGTPGQLVFTPEGSPAYVTSVGTYGQPVQITVIDADVG